MAYFHAKEGAEMIRDTYDLIESLPQIEADIANHYIGGLKYGMAGSDGSCTSNYIWYMTNNHDVLSIFFADQRNPFVLISSVYPKLSGWTNNILRENTYQHKKIKVEKKLLLHGI